ncbi:erythromycin esterase family protein [Streptomyces sp. NPDC019990]|uniref:erythromycin esterase family protein n=1 Tax=Streptomyces sp. NPDC019990 TaxID=3154693 RepID=UPI003410E922
MTRHRIAIALTSVVTCGAVAAGLPAVAAPADQAAMTHAPTTGPVRGSASTVVDTLDRASHPLRTVEPGGVTRDLRPLDRMIGDARVVGLGEATHSSHEFFTLKHRVFRHLVEEKGFRTFALEAPWSTGLRLNAYVLRGEGDPRRIMREEFQRDYLWWNNAEYLALVEWMRAYNRRHPDDPVRFMGDDFAWAGPELYDEVTDYVAGAHPGLLARFTSLYRGLRPTMSAGAYIEQYLNMPYAERKERADRTGRALRLLKRQAPGADRAAYDWAVRHATAVDQTARGYAFDFGDPEQLRAAMRFRDSVMADNVAWWAEHTGEKVLLSAHNAHVAYVPDDPAHYPKMQGAFLRDRLADAYVSIGFTFARGSFNATAPEDEVRRFSLGPAGPGSNERTLDRVRHRDYFVDLRTAPRPARNWLRDARPTRSIGTGYPEPERDIALAHSHDVLIHLNRVEAAHLRDRPPASGSVAQQDPLPSDGPG